MGVCVFGHPIRSDGGSLSGGSWESDLPLANMQHRRLSKVARSTSAASANTKFDVDLGAAYYIYGVALIGHNISLSGTVRIYADDNSGFSSPDYNPGAEAAIPDIYPSNMPQWEVPASRDGSLQQAEYDAGYVPDYIHICSSPQTERYWRIEIVDTGNADGYIEIGRLVIFSGYQPTINFKEGAQLGWHTTSTRTESDGGAIHHDERPRRRIFNFTIPEIEDDEAMVHLFELNRACGTHQQFFFVYDDDDTVHMHRRSFLSTIKQLSPLQIPHGLRMHQGFQLMEEL